MRSIPAMLSERAVQRHCTAAEGYMTDHSSLKELLFVLRTVFTPTLTAERQRIQRALLEPCPSISVTNHRATPKAGRVLRE